MLVRSTDHVWMMPHRDSAQNMTDLWKELKQAHKDVGIQDGFSDITESMFVPQKDKFPSLKGKANEVRMLARPLLSVWEKYMDGHNKQHRIIRIGLQASAGLETILENCKGQARLAGADATRFKDLCFKYAQCISSFWVVIFIHERVGSTT